MQDGAVFVNNLKKKLCVRTDEELATILELSGATIRHWKYVDCRPRKKTAELIQLKITARENVEAVNNRVSQAKKEIMNELVFDGNRFLENLKIYFNVATIVELSAILKIDKNTIHYWAHRKMRPNATYSGILQIALGEIGGEND